MYIYWCKIDRGVVVKYNEMFKKNFKVKFKDFRGFLFMFGSNCFMFLWKICYVLVKV